jgi:hypothetical protein
MLATTLSSPCGRNVSPLEWISIPDSCGGEIVMLARCISFVTLEEPSPETNGCRMQPIDECRTNDSFGFTMANVGADAPLFRACCDRNSSVELILRLIEEGHHALTKQDSHGRTLLHLACQHHRHSPEILHCLLDRCPPAVLGLRTSVGATPLHYACLWDVPIEIIRRMIRIYPEAGQAPLQIACRSIFPSLELIQLLDSECPIACLLNISDGRTPYHEAVHLRRPAVILDFLLEGTKQAALALVVFVDCSAFVTVSPVVVDHIHQVIPNVAQEGFSVGYMSSNEPIRQALDDPQTLTVLLNNNDLQEMLKDEDYQDVVCGMHRMIKASSRIISEIQLESQHHICILGSVSDTPDCFYIHLRNNPSLCCRSTRATATPIGAPPVR